MFKQARSAARKLYFEIQTHRSRWQQASKRPCVVIFPSAQPWASASNLRAWLVAPELRKLGWRTVIVPEALSLSQRRRILRLERPDIVLLQQTRHLLNDPALYAPYPCVLDADDADCLDPRHRDRIANCARNAAAVVGGSRFVAHALGEHHPFKPHVIWTCTPPSTVLPQQRPFAREPIVAWAHETPLAYPVEADLMQKVFISVAQRTRAIFWLFGVDEAKAREWFAPIRAAGGTCEAVPRMPYEQYLERVAEAAIGLQPVCLDNEFSQGKSFGKVLAYLAGQVAVIASNNVDHPLFFRDGHNGRLVDNRAEEWSNAIVPLLEDRELRERTALAGWQDFQQRLTTDVFAKLMVGVFENVLARRKAS